MRDDTHGHALCLGECALQPHLPVSGLAAQQPERRKSADEPQRQVALTTVHGESQPSQQVLGFLIELVEGNRLICSPQPRRGALDQRQEERSMPLLQLLQLTTLLQLFTGVVADRLQHPKAGPLDRGRGAVDEAVLQQTADGLQHAVLFDLPRRLRWKDNRCDCLQREAACEDGQLAEQTPRVRVEQRVTPADGLAQGVVTRRAIAFAGREQLERVLEAGLHCVRRQHVGARGGELDRQWQAFESGADLGHCPGIGVGEVEAGQRRPRAVGEQRHGWRAAKLREVEPSGQVGNGERRDRDDMLGPQAQRGAASDNQFE